MDDSDYDRRQSAGGGLRRWLILLFVVDVVVSVATFRQYLVGSEEVQLGDSSTTAYYCIISIAGLVNLVGIGALLARRKWGITAVGVGCVAMMLAAFPLVGTGIEPLILAGGSALAFWTTFMFTRSSKTE